MSVIKKLKALTVSLLFVVLLGSQMDAYCTWWECDYVRTIYTTEESGQFMFKVRRNGSNDGSSFWVIQSIVGPELYERIYAQVMTSMTHGKPCGFEFTDTSNIDDAVLSFSIYY